eukprot:304270_1
MSSISFGDVVKLVDDRIGTVRFIGCTEFSTDTPYYGLQLKQPVFEYDEYTLNTTGITDRKHYFNSPRNHGLFVERCDIKQIIRKHTSSASYSYNQIVKVLNLGKGTIKYIGLTHFGNSYWYGIVLETRIFLQIKTNAQQNNCIHYLSPNELNIYFDSDYQKSIFVRSNQLRRIKVTKQPKFHAEDTVNIISTNGYEEYINKTLISMMNHLNIPQTARPAIINMDSSKKVALIQQWFITSKKTYTTSQNEEKQKLKTKESNKKPQRIVHSNDIYSFEFRSKPFGIVLAITKDKKNLFVKTIDEYSAANRNVIIGSVLVKFEHEIVEDLGAKMVYKTFKKYLNRVPLRITFRNVTNEKLEVSKCEMKKDKSIQKNVNKTRKISQSNSDTLFNGCDIIEKKTKKKHKKKNVSTKKKRKGTNENKNKINKQNNNKSKKKVKQKNIKKQINKNKNITNSKTKTVRKSKKATRYNTKPINGKKKRKKKK